MALEPRHRTPSEQAFLRAFKKIAFTRMFGAATAERMLNPPPPQRIAEEDELRELPVVYVPRDAIVIRY